MSKSDPVPTRFDAPEEGALETLKRRTGLSKAEIIRRAVRLLRLRYEEEGSVGFIVEELSPEYRVTRTTDEAAAGYRVRKKSSKHVVMIPKKTPPG